MTFLKKDSPYPHWELFEEDSGDRLRIVPDRGGLITEWRSNGRDIIYFDLERFKQKGKSVRGGIPLLFPICGDLPNDILQLEKGDYILRQHGFARNSAWQLKTINHQNSFLLSLQDDKTSRDAYPYSFLLEIEVRLEPNALNFLITIQNLGEDIMPFSFGLHPYFNVRDLQTTRIEGLPPMAINHLSMLEAETELLIEQIPEGVDFICAPSTPVTLVDLSSDTRLSLQQEGPMDLTVVWTDPPRKMVCLEPWTSPRKSLISGERKLCLGAGSTQKLKCRFFIE